MILDHLSHAEQYLGLHAGFAAAFAFLRDATEAPRDPGTYPIDGTRVYALVQDYTTQDEDTLRWETHQRYLDIQYILEGEETIGWAEARCMKHSAPYNTEKDCTLAEGAQNATALRMTAGQFAILYPQDAHRPKCRSAAPCRVKKIVVKVEISP